jgi:hypothetical protein
LFSMILARRRSRLWHLFPSRSPSLRSRPALNRPLPHHRQPNKRDQRPLRQNHLRFPRQRPLPSSRHSPRPRTLPGLLSHLLPRLLLPRPLHPQPQTPSLPKRRRSPQNRALQPVLHHQQDPTFSRNPRSALRPRLLLRSRLRPRRNRSSPSLTPKTRSGKAIRRRRTRDRISLRRCCPRRLLIRARRHLRSRIPLAC